jgi:hypothetical protein
MNTQELTAAIFNLKPTAEFTFKENDYSTIEWIVLEGDAPTLEEIEKSHLAVKKSEEKSANDLIVKRNELLAKIGITSDEAALLVK